MGIWYQDIGDWRNVNDLCREFKKRAIEAEVRLNIIGGLIVQMILKYKIISVGFMKLQNMSRNSTHLVYLYIYKYQKKLNIQWRKANPRAIKSNLTIELVLSNNELAKIKSKNEQECVSIL